MTSTNPTYQRPAKQSLETLLDALSREINKELNCVKIGIIQAFDPGASGRAANVDVLISFTQVLAIDVNGVQTLAPYPLLANVPVIFPSGGGFTLTFPIAVGDECIVLFNDRQLDNWLESGAGQPPSIGRMHDFSDAIAFVGLRNNTRALAAISTTSTQLRSDDGATYVEIAGGGIVNVVAPTEINLTSPVVNITASTEVNVISPRETITGVLDVQNEDGEANPCIINGQIEATGDIIAGSGSSDISLLNHIHSGVTTGAGNTGVPV